MQNCTVGLKKTNTPPGAPSSQSGPLAAWLTELTSNNFGGLSSDMLRHYLFGVWNHQVAQMYTLYVLKFYLYTEKTAATEMWILHLATLWSW